jgi:hypothetical protein
VRRSSVDLAKNDVKGAKDGDDVRKHMTPGEKILQR